MHRFNMRTGELRILKPSTSEGREPLRFHWNSPLIMSRHKPGVLYLGGSRTRHGWSGAARKSMEWFIHWRNPSASGNFVGRNR